MSELFIARDPDESDELISWWQGDDHLEEETQITVGADEIAVFYDEEVITQVGPGRHMLSEETQPALADYLTSDDPPDIEVAFITVKGYELFFNEEAGIVNDPVKGTSFTPWLDCETFVLEVVDPGKLIAAVDSFSKGEDSFVEYLADIAFKQAMMALGELGESKSLHLRDVLDGKVSIEPTKIEGPVNQRLAQHGVRLQFPAPVVVTVDDDDREQLELELKH